MMYKVFCLLSVLFLVSCKSTTYFIVRHGEKAGGEAMAAMSSDPPLSAEGQKQALDLKAYLENKSVKTIYTTNYVRTMSTAEPFRQANGLVFKMYDPRKNNELVEELKNISDGNVLVVGHSNTVDDLVNGLMGTAQMTDLADNEYGHLLIVKKKGGRYTFERTMVPKTAPR